MHNKEFNCRVLLSPQVLKHLLRQIDIAKMLFVFYYLEKK